MASEYLSHVKELVRDKIAISINASNLIEESMSYSALSNSKMIRAGLIFASAKTNKNISQKSITTLAASVELMHTYSLIHDDLPCMDDDNFRRNQPSNHIKYGEANAVLAGDALQALAYEIICDDEDMTPKEKVYAIKILSQSCGKNGMVFGQHLDIENEENIENLTKEMLNEIHNLKTGKLIECSVMMGQIGTDQDEYTINILEDFSKNIGLAYQITDDILDVTETQENLGKNINSDIKNNKATYIDIIGLENAKKEAESLTHSALAKIRSSKVENIETLIELAQYLIKRKN
ncbi:polyprenyl synthetase family protein [Gammaproteobacteria bacterium]|nr:polyprenyl synthetase family protein [Gammaproteobacteria bacterium]